MTHDHIIKSVKHYRDTANCPTVEFCSAKILEAVAENDTVKAETLLGGLRDFAKRNAAFAKSKAEWLENNARSGRNW